MNSESFLKHRLICVAVIDKTGDAVPLAEALFAGGLNVIEVTFRTANAAESIAQIRKRVPQIVVGAGTLSVSYTHLPSRPCSRHRGNNAAIFPEG